MTGDLRTVLEELKHISDKYDVPIIIAKQSSDLHGFKPGELVALGEYIHPLEKKIRPGAMEPNLLAIHARKLKEYSESKKIKKGL